MKARTEEIILREAYDALLSGHKRQVFSTTFDDNDPNGNFRKAAIVCRYAFEYYLRWDPMTVRDCLTWDIIRKLKLSKFIEYIPHPEAINPKEELYYVAWKLYPDRIYISDNTIAVKTMQARIANELGRFPDGFFSDRNGMRRLKACVAYMIEANVPADSPRDIYSFFATSKGRQLVKDSKLLSVYKEHYPNMIEMIHDCLIPEQRDEFARSYYGFCLDGREIGSSVFEVISDEEKQYA